MNLRFPGVVCYVLDDEEEVRQILGLRLSRLGATYRLHDALASLMASVRDTAPDIIFLDVAIGETDAINAVRQLSAAGYAGYIQIISGIGEHKLADIHAVCEGYGYGALYPLSKPFGKQAIEETLKAVAELKVWATANTTLAQPDIGFALSRHASDGSIDGVLSMQQHLLADEPQSGQWARSPINLASSALAWSARLQVGQRFAVRIHMSFAGSVEAIETGQVQLLTRFVGITPMFVVAQPDVHENWQGLRELRARLSVYGVRLGVLMASLSRTMLSVVDLSLCDEILFGEQLVMQVASSESRHGIAEEIAARSRLASLDLHALGGDVATHRNVMARLGVKFVSPSLSHFRSEEEFERSLTDDPLEGHRVVAAHFFDELPHFEGKNLLSVRELQVLSFIVQGKSSKETALALDLSPRTVDVHRSRILAKLGRRNAAELVALVHKRGT